MYLLFQAISMMITAVWVWLIIHVVYGTTITINNDGKDSVDCCMKETCLCSSLSSALHYMQNNTVINITSKLVMLHDILEMGSGHLSNITITGNGVTIMCNNTGGVYCESCGNVTIRGITWYQCGHNDPGRPITHTPTLDFMNISNLIIQDCIFQNSSGCPVYVQHAREKITINGSSFMANIFDDANNELSCAGLFISCTGVDLNISISASRFDGNGCRFPSEICHHYGAVIESNNTVLKRINFLIENTSFSYNSHGLYLSTHSNSATVQLSNMHIYHNAGYGIVLAMRGETHHAFADLNISFAAFMNNVYPLTILTSGNKLFDVTININNSAFSSTASIFQSGLNITSLVSYTKVTMLNCILYNNYNDAINIQISNLNECTHMPATISFTNITVYNTTTSASYDATNAGVCIVTKNIIVSIMFTKVNFTSNYFSRHNTAALHITNHNANCDPYSAVSIQLSNCTFYKNIALDDVVILYITAESQDSFNDHKLQINLKLSNCNFDCNVGGRSIVYIKGPTTSEDVYNTSMTINNSTFSNNKGTVLYFAISSVHIEGDTMFLNNSARSGAALYLEEVYTISSDDANVQFINNSAKQKGGAMYINLATNHCNVFKSISNISFINNSADIAGNSIYFNIPQSCKIITNASNKFSLLYFLNTFNYFQPIYVKNSPIVTSPHTIKLYPPEVVTIYNSNNYSIQQSKMLGEPIQFTASVLDYFNNVTEPVIFTIDCKTCGNDYMLSTYLITVHDRSLNELRVLPTVPSDVVNSTNISLTLLPVLSQSINTSLTIKLSSCHTRAGYLFDSTQRQCICYPYSDIVHCYRNYSEIKIGYWVGFLSEHYTSSICPRNYCNFAKRTETKPGFYALPREPDDLCNSHRTGVACGECKPGYILACESSDCISRDKCSAGMTILVIVLSILYWIVIVAVVFSLAYFQLQISSGYVYGIIYFYSIVDILLGDDVSQEVSQLVAFLSSFAKVTPQLFSQLCFGTGGLSGIDQKFIHYSHALAISVILLIIVLVTRYSPRLARFVRQYIIHVICHLLLLSYTSLASTSLQLLRPLTFNGINEIRTYLSPDIKYFTGRHLVYAIVAILCEVFIVIGLPLFLLFEPLLSRRINFVKIKPLLDHFQGCYKDKYRWFAAYYLICRQVIILIVYFGNGDHYNMLYYLQTACIVIAMIHGFVQPYKNSLVNGLDVVILLILVLVVNLNTFSLLSSMSSSDFLVFLVILPSFLFCFIVITKLLIRCYHRRKRTLQMYYPVAIGDNERQEAKNIRCFLCNKLNFRESFLHYTDE